MVQFLVIKEMSIKPPWILMTHDTRIAKIKWLTISNAGADVEQLVVTVENGDQFGEEFGNFLYSLYIPLTQQSHT